MDYQKIHDKIIEQSLLRENKDREDGFHIHHIQPKSMGGSNNKTNLVKLTYREHFVIHHLLYKIHKTQKMACAFHFMSIDKYNYSQKLSSKEYALLCESKSRKGMKHSEETKLKMSKSRKGRFGGKNHPQWGKPMSEKTKEKLRQANIGKVIPKEQIEKSRLTQLGKPKHTKEWKSTMSKSRTGSGNSMYGKTGKLCPRSVSVNIDGIVYDSMSEAAKKFGVTRKTITYRVKSGSLKFKNYNFVDI